MLVGALYFLSLRLSKTNLTSNTKAAENNSPNLVYGGNAVDIKNWPFMVEIIYFDDPANLQFFDFHYKYSPPLGYEHNLNQLKHCSGTLLSNQWVLTAAHCVSGIKAEKLGVAVGFTNITDFIDNTNKFVLSVDQVIPRTDYMNNNFSNDLALLHLGNNMITNEPQTFPPYTTYIGLNTNKSLETEKTPIMLLGYGATEISGTANENLNAVMVALISNARANKPYWYNGQVLQNMTVAGFPLGGQSECNGDSGGANLIFDGNHWLENGVASWIGEPDLQCAVAYNPTVFTDLAVYAPWIYKETGINPNDPSYQMQLFKGSAPALIQSYQNYQNRLIEFNQDDLNGNSLSPTSKP